MYSALSFSSTISLKRLALLSATSARRLPADASRPAVSMVSVIVLVAESYTARIPMV
ncbi:hypothetical protein [Klebsiella phage pKP-BM327-1.2]|nr:hypothetical protein [Klebsiella phage pKP-BM327-1.2]DAH75861.1 MAG TPA: hypothetical protein [Caudoviricetes sp.]